MRQGSFLRPLLISVVGLCLLLSLSWLPILFPPPAALASSFVVGSDPVDGSTISVPPTQVRIFFNTPISSASIANVYFGIDYQVMNAGRSHVARTNPQELDTPLLTQLPEGSYTVRWTAISATDGHATHGVIGFNIGHSSTGLPGQVILGPSTSNILPQLSLLGILAIAWDWLVMAALALWIGILVMESVVLADGKQSLPLQWLTLAGLILLTLALSEDVTQLAQAHVSAVILDWLFLVAQGVWFGGAAYLGFVLLPLLPTFEPELHARSLVTLIQRYTPLIAGSIVVLFVSAYTLFFLTPQLRRQVMLLHVVNAEMPARRTRQAALERNERRLKVTTRSLAYLGAGVLLCAAFMSFFAPPIVFPAIDYTNGSSTNTAPSTTNTQVIQTKHTGNLTVSLQVIPARVGYDNTVIVTLSDSNGNPITDAQVQININMVTMNMGTASATIKSRDPTYVAVFNKDETFSMPGLWDIALKIQRPNQPPVQVSFQVTLTG